MHFRMRRLIPFTVASLINNDLPPSAHQKEPIKQTGRLPCRRQRRRIMRVQRSVPEINSPPASFLRPEYFYLADGRFPLSSRSRGDFPFMRDNDAVQERRRGANWIE